MAKSRYQYNPHTCRYEPFYLRGRAFRRQLFVFMTVSFFVALGGYFWLRNYFETVDELLLERTNHTLKLEWNILRQRIDAANQKLATFIEKDDNNYRVIIDTQPLAPSIREAGVGGSEKINYAHIKSFPAIAQEYVRLEKLNHQVEVELQSYTEINAILDQKMSAWSCKPAIQPLSNWELTYLHTRYGARMHPILGFIREHKGLDFSADIGTPVYATGDGRIKNVYYSESLGNVIFLDHIYGYETRYAHLSRFNVRAGQQVKRGELIGYVGDTGLSHGPHLHYEVLYHGVHVNPINFFQRDLNNQEYEKLIDLAGKSDLSLD